MTDDDGSRRVEEGRAAALRTPARERVRVREREREGGREEKAKTLDGGGTYGRS